MKIKRLEINGFKSFADKVVLDFQQGVTGVVGPNGCGKSNIVDAIRWCMGEQSAKNLRGKAMEDVIFAGSESRKPLGVAEVSLVFSTEDGRAPAKYLEYSEIQLTRRLYRDGESDYLINKTPCRLLDITELFMDTGVGTRAYSIIEQGKIGQILHSRPEERRFLIEEAAGVTKFKARKQLALKKIDSTRHNLSRLSDVLGEIRRQLASLQRQAKKAQKFREYRDEFRETELLFTAREFLDIQEQRRIAEGELTVLNNRTHEVFSSLSLGEARVEESRLALVEQEKFLNGAQEEIYRVRSEFSSAEQALEFRKRELAGIEGQIRRLDAETGELEKRLAECTVRREQLELRRDAAQVESATLGEELRAAEDGLAGHRQTEEEMSRLLEGRRRELFEAMSEAAQHRNRQETAGKRLLQVNERMERHARESAELAGRSRQVHERTGALDRELSLLETEQDELKIRLGALRLREEEVKARLPECEKAWQASRDELNLAASRLRSLQELEARFAGYGQGVKSLMTSPEFRPGFDGFLADAIQTAPELEAAVEAALAGHLQSIVCHEAPHALRSIDFLKSSGGRGELALPVDETLPDAPAVAGAVPLAGQVQASGPCAPLVRRLLRGVMLTGNLSQALELARNHPEALFVTRDGDLVSHGGLVSGGSATQVQQGLIHKKRELRELEELSVRLGEQTAVLERERAVLQQDYRDVTEQVRVGGSRLHQIELRLAGLRKDRQQALDEIGRIGERIAVQEMEKGTFREEQQELEEELRLAAERLAASSSSSKELELEVNRLKGGLDARRDQVAAVREQVTALRVKEATLKEQYEACVRGIADLDRQTSDLVRRSASDREDAEKGSAERLRLQEAIAGGTIRVEELLQSQIRAEQALTALREAFESATVTLDEAEKQARRFREESDAVRTAQSELKLRFSTLSMQAEHLERSMQEKSRITMAEAIARHDTAEFDEPARRARQGELQRLLDEMGEVNLMAIEECAGMEERFAFLTGQRDDLEESLRSLQQAIQRINRTTRQRFQETYDLVNAKFQEVFPRLFCGGKAELRLTNEEDLLETGIDIIVQPPGKKLQNVTLLSGGEKALTAVALIFAIFLIKPTPFCLLDEVDAPLDDANIGRFNDMVREMSAISQFIIITHNKATMQVADTLYGITMEEPGASKVVSVRLH